MLLKVMIFGGICLDRILSTIGHCVDIHSQIISQGLHYVPGPNSCTLCICDKGGPKWCKSVLCSQPQNCKSFQRGNSCCEFKCLDDILTASDTYKDTYDLALRLIASAVFIILTVSLLFFIIHRFRRYKLRVQQNRQLNEDQRSLNSIGYITGSLGYLPGNIGYLGSGTNDLELHYEETNGHYSLWKPPENYFPRGEAPPPYEEAIRCSQIDTNVITSQSLVTNTPTVGTQSNEIRLNQQQPTTMQCRHQHLMNRTNMNQEYANITIETVNTQHTNPLIKIENIKPLANSLHVDVQNNCVTTTQDKEIKTTSSKKSKSCENIITNKKSDNTRTSPEQKTINHKSQIFTDCDRSNIDKNNLKLQKYENVMIKNSTSREIHNKKLNKIHTDKEIKNEICYENINPCYENTAHRTIPFIPERQTKHQSYIKESKSKDNMYIPPESSIRKNFNAIDLIEKLETNIKNTPPLKNSMDMPLHRTLPKNLKELTISVSSNSEYIPSNIFKQFETNNLLHRSLPKQLSNRDTVLSVNLLKSQINLTENLSREMSPLKMVKNEPTSSSSISSTSHVGFSESKVEDKGKNKDDERSFISYQYLSSQDEDDYRSECENCKSSEIVNLEDEEGDVFNETMTLQRRPEISEEVPYYRTSLTLPTQIRKPRAVTPNANRNGWFMAMQETSSSEESD